MSLTDQYESAIANGQIVDSPIQRQVLPSMEKLLEGLESKWRFWFRRRSENKVKGLYLYGPVGIGKTFLMDLLYRNIADRHKQRIHFHQFMQQIDGQLRRLQGHSDPLKAIANKLTKETHVLCLDEFLVMDIATAMVLTELIRYIFDFGMTVIMTSNTSPDDLYLNGLQRVRFLPTIALIKQHCEVIHLTGSIDYRLGRELSFQAYLFPLTTNNSERMSKQFDTLVSLDRDISPLSVQGRFIPYVKRSEKVIWFHFDDICNLPRSQLDYLEIANRFNTIFVDNIPQLTSKDTVRALLLTHFIDVMYDKKVRLVLLAEVDIDALYLSGEVSVAFRRTRSRLHEMQSESYFIMN